MTQEPVVWTIGHSDHPPNAFFALLELHEIERILDVRSHPYSRRYPHFQRWTLERGLVRSGIEYRFLGHELGARPDDGGVYQDGRVDFDRLAKRPRFLSGISQVVDLAKDKRSCLLCAEAEPLDCHRTLLVGRELRRRGIELIHILRNGALEPSAAADLRLVDECGFRQMQVPLFGETPHPIDAAYLKRSRQIAYQKRIVRDSG